LDSALALRFFTIVTKEMPEAPRTNASATPRPIATFAPVLRPEEMLSGAGAALDVVLSAEVAVEVVVAIAVKLAVALIAELTVEISVRLAIELVLDVPPCA
jgi:hypothetical protein